MTSNDGIIPDYDPANDPDLIKVPKSEIDRFHDKDFVKELVNRERNELQSMRDETLELAGNEFDGDLASINSGSIECLLMIDDAEKKIESDTVDFDKILFQAKTRRIDLEKALAEWKGRQP